MAPWIMVPATTMQRHRRWLVRELTALHGLVDLHSGVLAVSACAVPQPPRPSAPATDSAPNAQKRVL